MGLDLTVWISVDVPPKWGAFFHLLLYTYILLMGPFSALATILMGPFKKYIYKTGQHMKYLYIVVDS